MRFVSNNLTSVNVTKLFKFVKECPLRFYLVTRKFALLIKLTCIAYFAVKIQLFCNYVHKTKFVQHKRVRLT